MDTDLKRLSLRSALRLKDQEFNKRTDLLLCDVAIGPSDCGKII